MTTRWSEYMDAKFQWLDGHGNVRFLANTAASVTEFLADDLKPTHLVQVPDETVNGS